MGTASDHQRLPLLLPSGDTVNLAVATGNGRTGTLARRLPTQPPRRQPSPGRHTARDPRGPQWSTKMPAENACHSPVWQPRRQAHHWHVAAKPSPPPRSHPRKPHPQKPDWSPGRLTTCENSKPSSSYVPTEPTRLLVRRTGRGEEPGGARRVECSHQPKRPSTRWRQGMRHRGCAPAAVQGATLSHCFSSRWVETDREVPSCWANKETRNSSSIQRNCSSCGSTIPRWRWDAARSR